MHFVKKNRRAKLDSSRKGSEGAVPKRGKTLKAFTSPDAEEKKRDRSWLGGIKDGSPGKRELRRIGVAG